MIGKIQGIKIAERVFSILDDALERENENGRKLYAYLQTFNNCREQGFYLTVSDYDFDNADRNDNSLYVYVCECRDSDDILVVFQTDIPDYNGMFSEKAYACEGRFDYKKCFPYDGEHKAAKWIYEEIRKFFKL